MLLASIKNFPVLFGMPGTGEWIVILLVILLFVGPKRLPELMRSIGKSVHAFKKGMKETDDDQDSKPDQNTIKPS